jgi:hypothetical protein
MTGNHYEEVASIVSRIRNARFADMVNQLEQLIDSEIWREFTTPIGTHFTFQPYEFDYFLAAQEIDPTTVKYAYLKAEGVEQLAAKQTRLADITGHGRPPANGDRRPRADVARIYGSDPSGAGARIRAYGRPVVTERTSQVAADPERRKEYESTGKGRERAKSKYWRVRWSDDTPAAKVIAEALLRDPELAHDIYKILSSSESLKEHLK